MKMEITKEDIVKIVTLLDKFYTTHMDEIQRKHPEIDVYELEPEELWDLDDGDNLLQDIDNLQATLEKKLTEMAI